MTNIKIILVFRSVGQLLVFVLTDLSGRTLVLYR